MILAHFLNFGNKNCFSKKNQFCNEQIHEGFQHHAKIQEKLMTQFKENAQTDRKTEKPIDPIL